MNNAIHHTPETTQEPNRLPNIGDRCSTVSWCTMRAEDAEHQTHHAGDIIDLAGSDGTGRAGWWGWLWEDTDPTGPTTVTIEGFHTRGGEPVSADLSAATLAVVLSATATPEAREALRQLVLAAGIEVPA